MDINRAEHTSPEAESIKKKITVSSGKRFLLWGVCISLLCACIFTALYGVLHRKADRLRTSPVENGNTISFLFMHSYLLYRDLYNKVNHTELDFTELYLPATEGNEWIYREDAEETLYSGNYDEAEADTEKRDFSSLEEEYAMFTNAAGHLTSSLDSLDSSFSQLNLSFDYLAEDLNTGETLTNLSSDNISADKQYFMLSFTFDENGNVSLGDMLKGNDPTIIRKYANEVMRGCSMENLTGGSGQQTYLFDVEMPKNFRITFCIAESDWVGMQDENLYLGNYVWSSSWNGYEAYRSVGTGNIFMLLLAAVFAAAILLPFKAGTPVSQDKIWSLRGYALPFEAVAAAMLMIFSFSESNMIEFVMFVADGKFAASLSPYIPVPAADIFVYMINIVMLGAFFLAVWYLGSCMRPLRNLGIRKYFKRKCLIYRFFPFIRKRALEFYEALSHFDVTKNARNLIWKIIIINGILLFVISSLWVGGFFIAVIYSVLLYFVLKKYISDIQKKYSMLLGYINKIAEGNLNGNMIDDLGVFNPFKPQLIRIQRGFKKAVEEEVKSSKMKSELITNVSHDLKTPLTAIITYVNLLKDENLTAEQRKEYLDTLERKSLRLKVLIEDLFEVSKASTGNVTLNIVNVDIMNLVKQVVFELSDKLKAASLDMRVNITDEKVILPLDSQKTYRIYENLIGNIAKYAMPGTRVYINGFRIDDTVVITLKNITAQEINVTPQELTERFIRGDSSRNTEGSGLGLAIAKSFVELQNGRLELEVDGDLFKVTTTWKTESHSPEPE